MGFDAISVKDIVKEKLMEAKKESNAKNNTEYLIQNIDDENFQKKIAEETKFKSRLEDETNE